MGAQREPKNHIKSLKKGIENYFFFLLVPFGAQGVPGITFEWILAPFLSDFSMIFSRCGKLLLAYPRSIFYYALSFFATLSGPPCHYRYIPESVDQTLKVDTGSPLGEVERGRVREGEIC